MKIAPHSLNIYKNEDKNLNSFIFLIAIFEIVYAESSWLDVNLSDSKRRRLSSL